MKSGFLRILVIVISSLMILAIAGLQPAQALDKSRVFTWLMFYSGLGASAAGVIIQGQANESYDQYLHTANQVDMDEYIDDYEQKHQQSMIATRTGVGLVIGAVLISLIDAANIPPPAEEEVPSFLGFGGDTGDRTISAHTRDGELLFAINRRF